MTDDWRREAMATIEAECEPELNVWVSYDEDGDPEAIIYAHGEGHGRVLCGNDGDKRYAFWSYGWQGFGGGQFACEPTAEAMRRVAFGIKQTIKAERRFMAADRARLHATAARLQEMAAGAYNYARAIAFFPPWLHADTPTWLDMLCHAAKVERAQREAAALSMIARTALGIEEPPA